MTTRKEIYVLASFRMNQRGSMETGCVYWFSSKEGALKYLKLAGKRVPGSDSTYYDDPFEYRYSYAVVEKVCEGPYGANKVLGWWKAEYNDGRLKIVKCRAPFDASSSFGFTGVG